MMDKMLIKLTQASMILEGLFVPCGIFRKISGKNLETLMKIKCVKCNEISFVRPRDILRKGVYSCKFCKNKFNKMGEKNVCKN